MKLLNKGGQWCGQRTHKKCTCGKLIADEEGFTGKSLTKTNRVSSNWQNV